MFVEEGDLDAARSLTESVAGAELFLYPGSAHLFVDPDRPDHDPAATDLLVRRAHAFLAAHVAPCRYVDSQQFAAPGEWPTFDGQHYTAVGYLKWAVAIDEAITKLAQTAP